jgi:hypothetical protein
MPEDDYRGIILNVSQRDKTVFNELNIIGKKNVVWKLVVLFKVRVPARRLDGLIEQLQSNMAESFVHFIREFYCHFYRANELIIVFRKKVFKVGIDPSAWRDAIEYGKSLGIPAKQLDFVPHRIEDEQY